MKNTITLKIISLVALLLVVGFGCRGPSAEQLASVQPVTLNYWTVFNDVAEIRKLATKYEQLRTYVKVNVRQVRFEEFEKLFVNALADDVSPDVVSIHSRSLRQFQNRLSAMPASVQVANVFTQGKYQPETVVQVYTERLPTLNAVRGNFVRSVADDVVIGGQTYGLPMSIDTLAIFYNKDLLDRSGVPLAPATWEEFIEAVKKTTKFDTAGNIIQSGVAMGTATNIPNAVDILSLLLMQNGLSVANRGGVGFASGLDQRFDSDTHPTFEALRFYTDFARPIKDTYSWNSSVGDAFEAFVSGRSVFYIGYAFDHRRIRARAPQLNVEVIAMPQLNASAPINITNYWVEAVPLKSTHQNEAWDFVRFLTTPENIKAYTEATGQPSPLRLHIASQTEDPVLAPFATQVLQADNWYRGRDWVAADQTIRTLITNYLQPYGENEDGNERDGNLIINAARTIQQTL